MSLEHRWSARKQVYWDAVVFHRPLGLLRAKILNIGLEGAFIAADHVKLPVPSMVEVTFSFNSTGSRGICQMEAMVIHRNRGGYGLMFKDFKLKAFRALKDALYAA